MRFVLAVVLGVVAVGCGGSTAADSSYFGTFRVTREATSHMRSDAVSATVSVERGPGADLKLSDSAGCVVYATPKDLHGDLGASYTLHDATCASLDGWTFDGGGLLFATCPGYATCSADYVGPRLEMRALGTYDKQSAQVYWYGVK